MSKTSLDYSVETEHAPMTNTDSLRKRVRNSLFFCSAATVFAVAVTSVTSDHAAIAEAQFMLATVYSETAAESAVDMSSLEEARLQFIEMLNILRDNLDAARSQYGPLNGRADRRYSRMIVELQSIAEELAEGRHSENDPARAIMDASDRLRVMYRETEGAIPAAMPLSGLYIRRPILSPQVVDRLDSELDGFERSIQDFEQFFPLDEARMATSDEYKSEVVRAGEIVCQESRLSFFLMSLDWESPVNDSSSVRLVSRFAALEEKAVEQCQHLRDSLPSGPRRSHVSKFTASIERRLRAALAYRDADWSRLRSVLQEPLRDVL